MSQSVTIKSNKYGINLILDADMPFADLIKAVVEKFKASANFFKNAKLYDYCLSVCCNRT